MDIRRTDASNPDFMALVAQLDAYLTITDGDEHAFYDQFNKTTHIKNVLVVYTPEGMAVSCGAIKPISDDSMEIKRMFTLPSHRGQGLASAVFASLENWAKELGYQSCVLETGKRQTEAIALYLKNNYQIIPNYGQHIGVENSLCFEKKL